MTGGRERGRVSVGWSGNSRSHSRHRSSTYTALAVKEVVKEVVTEANEVVSATAREVVNEVVSGVKEVVNEGVAVA